MLLVLQASNEEDRDIAPEFEGAPCIFSYDSFVSEGSSVLAPDRWFVNEHKNPTCHFNSEEFLDCRTVADMVAFNIPDAQINFDSLREKIKPFFENYDWGGEEFGDALYEDEDEEDE